MGWARVWTRRSSTWVTLGLLVAVVAGTWWLLARGAGTAGVLAGSAGVLAGPVAVLGLGTALFGLYLRPRATDHGVLARAARDLTGAVDRHEAAIERRLLSSPPDITRPQAAMVRWRTDDGGETGSLNTVADFYRRLPDGRLAVVGRPGAGKTVLAIRGLLDLIRAMPTDPGVRLRVPVRLNLPDFHVADAPDPATISARVDDWIAGHLVLAYHQRPAVARALVEQGWLLPILDGLDELDPDDARALGPALRPPRPFILTCGPDRYAELAIPETTAIHLQPLTIEQVAAWLTYRFPDDTKPPGVEHRWLRVLRHLATDQHGPLATCLRSPRGLHLTVAAYRDPATNPDDLLTVPTNQLDDYLRARARD